MTPRTLIGRAVATAALVLGLGLAGFAFAQQGGCKADVEKFCPGAQEKGQVAGCLKQNREQLSPQCKQRVRAVAQEMKAVGEACENDMHTLCSGVQPGGGRIAACLKQNEDKLAPACKSKLAEVAAKKK